jgi:DUF971 family protein
VTLVEQNGLFSTIFLPDQLPFSLQFCYKLLIKLITLLSYLWSYAMSLQSVVQRSPVEINAGKSSPTVEVVWDDGHRSLYSVHRLRQICPCATCREAAGKPAHQPLIGKPVVPKGLRSLPIFKPEQYKIVGMNYVGNYALGVNWEDKHQSIFPWALLNEECPCAECSLSRELRAQTEEQVNEH